MNKTLCKNNSTQGRIASTSRCLEDLRAGSAASALNYHTLIHFCWRYRQRLLRSNVHLKAWSGTISVSYRGNRLEESIPGPPSDWSFTVLILLKSNVTFAWHKQTCSSVCVNATKQLISNQPITWRYTKRFTSRFLSIFLYCSLQSMSLSSLFN